MLEIVLFSCIIDLLSQVVYTAVVAWKVKAAQSEEATKHPSFSGGKTPKGLRVIAELYDRSIMI
eukprot:jgi/Galph1/4664/GphlegSOOS_G3412.1